MIYIQALGTDKIANQVSKKLEILKEEKGKKKKIKSKRRLLC